MSIRENEQLWVQLRPQGLYYARRAAGHNDPLQEGECPDWDSLPAEPGMRLLLCVPGVQVRTHLAAVPTRNRKQFFSALPFALEDRLFRALETYHFVPLTKPAGKDGTPVAVVGHEQMAEWTGTALARGLDIELLTPDYLLLPAPEPDTWLLDALEKPLLLRFPRAAGGAALNENTGPQPPGGLQLALEQTNRAPRRLEVRVRKQEQYEQVGNWQTWLAERDIELVRLQADMSRPAWLARQAAPPGQVNLLTGKYHQGRNKLLQTRRYLPAAGLAAALVLVLAAQWFVEHSRIKAEHQRLTRAIEDTYREAFPGARNLVNPRHQMEQRLVAASEQPAAGGQGPRVDILDWLESLAPHLGKQADVRLKSFIFDGRQLTLDLSLPDFEALEALRQQLAGTLLLRVENTELREGRVHSRIHLEAQT